MQYENLERIAREADYVLPGHEPKLFTRQPAWFPGNDGGP